MVGGMDMSIKDQLLFLWLLMVIVLSLFTHFWSFIVYMIQKAVAFGMVPLLVSKLATGLAGIHFFP